MSNALGVESSTIKAKLMADIRAGEQNPNTLGKRWGLNGHDLVKNLEQLRKEGFIAFKWGLGDRIERVWIPKGKQNMDLLRGHTRTNGHIDYIELVADAINGLPWGDRGFRVWSKSDVVNATGLKSEQVAHAVEVLRSSGRMQQLGGGGRGKPIMGVRWRGEQPPEASNVFAEAVTVSGSAEPASGPSQAVRDTAAYLRSLGKSPGFPQLTAALEQWHKMETAHGLLIETGHDELADALATTGEFLVMSTLAAELEVLMKAAGRASS